MMSLNFFKQRHFVGTIFVAFALGASLYSFNTFLTALMQNYIGYSALQTGVRQLTISGWSLVLGPISGYLGTRFSKKTYDQRIIISWRMRFFGHVECDGTTGRFYGSDARHAHDWIH